MITKHDLWHAAHKLGYLVRDYPGDKESRRLAARLTVAVLEPAPRVVPFEPRWSYYP